MFQGFIQFGFFSLVGVYVWLCIMIVTFANTDDSFFSVRNDTADWWNLIVFKTKCTENWGVCIYCNMYVQAMETMVRSEQLFAIQLKESIFHSVNILATQAIFLSYSEHSHDITTCEQKLAYKMGWWTLWGLISSRLRLPMEHPVGPPLSLPDERFSWHLREMSITSKSCEEPLDSAALEFTCIRFNSTFRYKSKHTSLC